jgi:NAD(P)-dependent dehydrogenase (short-subunit alcohol dehydrogenase family)
MMSKLKGKVAIVTGASKGIGASIARHLAAEGAAVVVNYSSSNVLGLILASQEAVKHFGPAGGRIVNISSVVSTYAPANTSVYSATKAAVDAVTRSLAKELGPRKIRVNSMFEQTL